MRTTTLKSAVVVAAVLGSGLVTAGCSPSHFEEDCTKAGGTVQTDTERQSGYKRVNGKRKPTTRTVTVKECIDENGDVIDRER